MKIAIYHNLPSGGGKRALHEMTRRLADRHDIDVYTLNCAEHDFCDLRPYVRRYIVSPFNPLPLARRPFGRLNQGIRTLELLRLHKAQRRIAHQIDTIQYDVVFVHHCRFAQSPSLLSFLRTRAVYYCQEPPRFIYEPYIPRPYTTFSRAQQVGNLLDPLPDFHRSVMTRLDRANTQAATSVLTNSAFSRESLYRIYGVFAHVCYLGVDVDLFRPLSMLKEAFVLSVGALNPHKGFDFLIRSLALVDPLKRPPLLIVSNSVDEREKIYLQALAHELSVRVSFRSLVSDDELVKLYNQAQLTVYTPIMEPFGFAPLESMACQTPVVGVREGGVRESVTDGVTGLLVDREPEAVAATIGALLDRAAEVDQLGKNGRSCVEANWTWEKSVANIEHYLQQTAQGRTV